MKLESNGIYITLDSNNSESKIIFKDNDQCSFSNVLQNPLVLPQNDETGNLIRWEIALDQLILANGFHNITSDLCSFKYGFSYDDNKKVKEIEILIPPGFYDPLTYTSAINFKIHQWKLDEKQKNNEEHFSKDYLHKLDQCKFNLDFAIEKRAFTLQLNESINEYIELHHEKLRHMWGDKEMEVKITKSGPLHFSANLNRFYSHIFVTSDIVGYSIVGSQQIPLLRIVHLAGELIKNYSSLLSKPINKSNRRFLLPLNHFNPSFERLQYVPLNNFDIKSINITMTNIDGNKFEFQKGTDGTIIVLHLRRVI